MHVATYVFLSDESLTIVYEVFLFIGAFQAIKILGLNENSNFRIIKCLEINESYEVSMAVVLIFTVLVNLK